MIAVATSGALIALAAFASTAQPPDHSAASSHPSSSSSAPASSPSSSHGRDPLDSPPQADQPSPSDGGALAPAAKAPAPAPASALASGAPSPLHVSGNRIVDAQGHTVVLRGVARPSMEWMCGQNRGISEGPLDDASVQAMLAWDVNVVRLHLNEHCWLGAEDILPQYSGQNYRSVVTDYVDKLQAAGLYVILDMHWSAPGYMPSNTQQKMADADHALDFWTSVATTFKDYPSLIFDLFNEPQGISDDCWLNGCAVEVKEHAPNGWQAVGMQQLVSTVRATGATQPVLLQCNGWGNHCAGVDKDGDSRGNPKKGWLGHVPNDPLHNIIAGAHLYDYTACNVKKCWNDEVAPVAKKYPVIIGEMGETDCNSDWIPGMTDWADARGISYVAYAWYVGSCSGTPALITDWSGTPSHFGVGYYEHLTGLDPAPDPVKAPVISPAGGAVSAPVQVTISTTTPNATIHYTLDGSQPTAASPVYGGAFTVSATTTVKALATATGLDPSIVSSATYTFVNPDGSPIGYTLCAGEFGTCTFTGTRSVAFGASGAYFYGTFTDSVVCIGDSFGGDPAFNVAKSCYVADAP
ncbi:cellulase family glycosylhydrolase [Galbitalea sp. SE-J8]|uniref:cellulase family glycosylhydrolase n=1 Tax=Galbitalea sp. SE-J8 TaxID=3054952 RepID=UPI00259C71AB|nr:cellulase family glycosylhydrolase [Galbitalea sp. SE-J8]MDM4762048.1 cellulase family glycosylhydrolase [Galbitalea sp. SE-J8]